MWNTFKSQESKSRSPRGVTRVVSHAPATRSDSGHRLDADASGYRFDGQTRQPAGQILVPVYYTERNGLPDLVKINQNQIVFTILRLIWNTFQNIAHLLGCYRRNRRGLRRIIVLWCSRISKGVNIVFAMQFWRFTNKTNNNYTLNITHE